MKKKLLIIWSVITPLLLCAGERDLKSATDVAAAFFAQASDTVLLTAPRQSDHRSVNVQLAYQQLKSDNSPAFYVFNNPSCGGYVIVSGDDRAETVLGYADEGSFDMEQANPSLKWWLSRYERQLSSLQDSVANVAPRKASTTAIFPLLGGIKWGQEVPFYNKCPIDLFTSQISMTGCVATAAAQIMAKWKYPEHGTGTHDYYWCLTQYNPYKEECKKLSLKYDTIYFDWDNMRDTYKSKYTDAESNAVAALMYACGVACDMEYSSSGSGAFTDDMGYGLITYFGYTYTKFATATTRSMYVYSKGDKGIALTNAEFSCTTTQLEEYMNADLEAGRPILMGGRDNMFGGHEFVCDGRDTSGKFHINWGWKGDENGYFTLSALGQSYDFSDDIDIVVGLEPKNRPVGLESVQQEKTSFLRKVIINGKLMIEHENSCYNALGQRMK